MLRGIVKKSTAPGWYAGCDTIGAYTQGKSRKAAREMLADAIETLVDRRGFEARVVEAGKIGEHAYEVAIDSNQPDVLAAAILRQQRARHQLSASDVAKAVGISSRRYVAYEQGTRVPTVTTFSRLLGVVAPELALVLGPATSRVRRPRQT